MHSCLSCFPCVCSIAHSGSYSAADNLSGVGSVHPPTVEWIRKLLMVEVSHTLSLSYKDGKSLQIPEGLLAKDSNYVMLTSCSINLFLLDPTKLYDCVSAELIGNPGGPRRLHVLETFPFKLYN